MRTYDIPYVKRGPGNYKPIIPLEKMTIKQIKETYINTCAKASGRLSACEKCENKCKEGKYAIDIMNGKIISEDTVPLYDGKTMLEKAREENAKRREQLEVKEQEKKESKRDDWWNESLKAEDQTEWVMNRFGITKVQAKRKIYQYKWYHGMAGSFALNKSQTNTETHKDSNTKIDAGIESKLDRLMKQQAQYQSKIDEFTRLRDECKQKIDVLCQAMDILNKEDA